MCGSRWWRPGPVAMPNPWWCWVTSSAAADISWTPASNMIERLDLLAAVGGSLAGVAARPLTQSDQKCPERADDHRPG